MDEYHTILTHLYLVGIYVTPNSLFTESQKSGEAIIFFFRIHLTFLGKT